MIHYRDFAFASPPRTGSTWFIKAAAEAGFGEGIKAKSHEPPPEAWNGYVVSMIRDPADWLEAYYSVMQGGKIGVSCVDQFADHVRESRTFNEFVNRYLLYAAGDIGEMHRCYQAASCIKVEELPYSGAEFFESLGVPKNRIERVLRLPKQNTHKRIRPVWDKSLRLAVYNAESEFCEQFDYFPR